MADYKCFKCEKEFSNEKSIISHLKIEHFCKDNTEPIRCVINYKQRKVCQHSFLTFGGLRKHLKTCLQSINNNVSSSILPEAQNGPIESMSGIDKLLESIDRNLTIDQQVPIYVRSSRFVMLTPKHRIALH